MKFLTRAWHAGDLSDAEESSLLDEYRAAKAAVLPRLPARFREFASAVDIHDSLVRQVRFQPTKRTVILDVRAGDLQAGYFDLSIRYAGVDLSRLDAPTLIAIARDPAAEALYHEVDALGDGAYIHRWLWWPYRELDVVFTEFDYEIVPVANRSFDRSSDPYIEFYDRAG